MFVLCLHKVTCFFFFFLSLVTNCYFCDHIATSPAPPLQNGSLPPTSSDWPVSGYSSSFSLSSSDGDSSGTHSLHVWTCHCTSPNPNGETKCNCLRLPTYPKPYPTPDRVYDPFFFLLQATPKLVPSVPLDNTFTVTKTATSPKCDLFHLCFFYPTHKKTSLTPDISTHPVCAWLCVVECALWWALKICSTYVN